MWTYNKTLQYPINIKCADPRLAKVIISQYGGPDGELAASLRYLSQRFGMPDQNAKAILNDIGTEAFPDLLGTCSTKYNASNTGRTTNLKLAAGKINGKVLLVGDEFSYNQTVGERTIAAGYKMAATYSGGKVVDGLGGGICQISSTLYDAVVFADLDVTVRRNHQFITSYLPGGKDATVVWGSQDFKFKNSRKYPIRITTTVSGGVATIQIWGHREETEYDISIETKKTATIAYTTQYINDSSLPVGTQKVVQNGNNGSKYEAYKVKRLNGEVVSRTLLSKDTYNAMQRIVKRGTKKTTKVPETTTKETTQEKNPEATKPSSTTPETKNNTTVNNSNSNKTENKNNTQNVSSNKTNTQASNKN